MEKLRIVVGGFIGLYPTGGVIWDYIQYVLGLKLLGHDVYYIEDTGQYSNYRITEKAWDDPHDSVECLKKVMKHFGLEDRWAYRDTFSRQCYGLPLSRVKEICGSANVFINISDASVCREEYIKIPKKVLIDSDPMFTQLQSKEEHKTDLRYPVTKFSLDQYDHHFSFGENIGNADCRIPLLDLIWKTTRQPICLNYWYTNESAKGNALPRFTTIMNWATRTKLLYANEEWGQKDVEFKKFISVPKYLKTAEFKVVMAASAAFKDEVDHLQIKSCGWKILNPTETINTVSDYRKFIADSDGEFSVAKETYVKSNSGWFSCRSACYLAMGKPVITQDTGWSKFIPAGQGLFGFSTMEAALDAIMEVQKNYAVHSKEARQIAQEFFDSEKVLTKMLEQIA